MATPNEKLAESLDMLKALQKGGKRVFRSDDLSRIHERAQLASSEPEGDRTRSAR